MQRASDLQGFRRVAVAVVVVVVALGSTGAAHAEVTSDDGTSGDTIVKRTTYPDGRPQREVTMKDGVKHGVEIWWSSSGMRTETTFEHGVEHGPFLDLWKNGNKKQDGQYEHGLKVGTWHDYDSEGQLLFENHYRFGELDGTKTQYGDGRGAHKGQRVVVRETEYVLGLAHGRETSYWSNGNINTRGSNVFGRREGEWASFASDGHALDSVSYVCGRKSIQIETPGAPGTRTCKPPRVSLQRPKRGRGGHQSVDASTADVTARLEFDKELCELVKSVSGVEVHVDGKPLKCPHFRIRTKTAAPGGTRG